MSSNLRYIHTHFTDNHLQSYLREALEEIAYLNKRGPYALKWSLKPHYSHGQESHSQQDSLVSAQSGLSAKVESEDEDDVKLEDIT